MVVGKQFTWQQNKKGNPLFLEQKKTFLAHSISEGHVVQRLHMPSDLQHQKENLSVLIVFSLSSVTHNSPDKISMLPGKRS